MIHDRNCSCSGCLAWRAYHSHGDRFPSLSARQPSVPQQPAIPPKPEAYQTVTRCVGPSNGKERATGDSGSSTLRRVSQCLSPPSIRRFSESIPRMLGLKKRRNGSDESEEVRVMLDDRDYQQPHNTPVAAQRSSVGYATAPQLPLKLPSTSLIDATEIDNLLRQSSAADSYGTTATPVSTGRLDGSSRFAATSQPQPENPANPDSHGYRRVRFSDQPPVGQPTIEVYEPLPIKRNIDNARPARRSISLGSGSLQDVAHQAQYDAIYDVTYQQVTGRAPGPIASLSGPSNAAVLSGNQDSNAGYNAGNNDIGANNSGNNDYSHLNLPAADTSNNGNTIWDNTQNVNDHHDSSQDSNKEEDNAPAAAWDMTSLAVPVDNTTGGGFDVDTGGAAAVTNAWDAKANTPVAKGKAPSKSSNTYAAPPQNITPQRTADVERLAPGAARRPVYWDTMQNPYVVFRFKYCSEGTYSRISTVDYASMLTWTDVIKNTLNIDTTRMTVEDFDAMSASMTAEQLRDYARSMVRQRVEELDKADKPAVGAAKVDSGKDEAGGLDTTIEGNPGTQW